MELFRAVKAHGVFALYYPPDRNRKPYKQQYLELNDGVKYWVVY